MIEKRLVRLFPPQYAAALLEACIWPPLSRHTRIDAITDQLVRLGFCRPRQDTSRGREWDAVRNGSEYEMARGM